MSLFSAQIRSRLPLLIVFSLLLPFQRSAAQQPFQFEKGLVVGNAYHYGREALYTDQLAWTMYNGKLNTPQEGAEFGKDEKGQSLQWKLSVADTKKRFINMGSRNAYLYLTYTADKEQTALLNIKGNSALYFNGVLHTGDPYALTWMYIPVKLRKGLNELYVRGQNISAALSFPTKPVTLNTEDATLPDVVAGKNNSVLLGAVVVINSTNAVLKNLSVQTEAAGKKASTGIPDVLPMTTRKVYFRIDGSGMTAKSKYRTVLNLKQGSRLMDTASVVMESLAPSSSYRNTFISQIDGSLQYYGVTPKLGVTKPGDALFFSVHGAGVEAIGQAKAYKSKDWGTVVTPTNRRPRGFNWEDWGRLDALEVLGQATGLFKPDLQHIYLMGHSMGGHGTWFLGATYPDKWAAIAPCSGYPTLKGYGSADGLIPETGSTPLESMLIRASNQSDVVKLAQNYKSLGVYVLHGDSDKVVSVDYARQMKKVLADFHPDFSYYEYPGGEHWFGDQSVDWKPIFDFFKWHQLKADSSVNRIDFTTANPGISSKYHWAAVIQQEKPLEYSRIQLTRGSKELSITGHTENIALLKLNLNEFAAGKTLKLTIDQSDLSYTTKTASDSIYLRKENKAWALTAKPGSHDKNPLRNGTFKEGFNHRMVFVYGTAGTALENEWSLNKARYDAETWYYRGNGAVDIIADKAYSPAQFKGRNVVLYGNSVTNGAWKLLLGDSPVQIDRMGIQAGKKTFKGDDLAINFVWPIKGTEKNSVSVIAGTGLKGLNAAFANQYLAGGSGFTDVFIYRLDMLKEGARRIEMATFFNNNWEL
ncbi:alpha/beta hydrolase-fold protein [Pedobacter sp. MC2016-15]|uniref:alpha/beta hydrolase-fold protein n=1 Tax=Pedobacter sp. MC2016-15 TaxID=2994473 RepID=UPI0022477392|nr:alpha/beta hydrolase-fold protein [Pedobacter sp. MC2016-15]MCX2480698.1 alpha/beta hydrolase-fold protein [Pedobacter sp. MC2016-15]